MTLKKVRHSEAVRPKNPVAGTDQHGALLRLVGGQDYAKVNATPAQRQPQEISPNPFRQLADQKRGKAELPPPPAGGARGIEGVSRRGLLSEPVTITPPSLAGQPKPTQPDQPTPPPLQLEQPYEESLEQPANVEVAATVNRAAEVQAETVSTKTVHQQEQAQVKIQESVRVTAKAETSHSAVEQSVQYGQAALEVANKVKEKAEATRSESVAKTNEHRREEHTASEARRERKQTNEQTARAEHERRDHQTKPVTTKTAIQSRESVSVAQTTARERVDQHRSVKRETESTTTAQSESRSTVKAEQRSTAPELRRTHNEQIAAEQSLNRHKQARTRTAQRAVQYAELPFGKRDTAKDVMERVLDRKQGVLLQAEYKSVGRIETRYIRLLERVTDDLARLPVTAIVRDDSIHFERQSSDSVIATQFATIAQRVPGPKNERSFVLPLAA